MTLDSEFTQHAPFLRALARRLATDQCAADDLVQETYVAAREGNPRGSGGLVPFFAAVLRNRAARRLRTDGRRRRREHAVASHAQTLAADSAAVADKLEVARRLLQHVNELGGDYRNVVFLRYYEDLSPKQIAQRLELPVGTIKTRLARALARLRERLDADDAEGRRQWLAALCAIGGVEMEATSGASTIAPLVRRAFSPRSALMVAIVVLATTATIWSLVPDSREPGALPMGTAFVNATIGEQPGEEQIERQASEPSPLATTVRGSVEDANLEADAGTGRPAANVVVRLRLKQPVSAAVRREIAPVDRQPSLPTQLEAPRPRTVEVETVTNAAGQFEFELPAHTELVSVKAVGDDFVRDAYWFRKQGHREPPEPLLLTRYPIGDLVGQVIEPSGAAVPGATVRLGCWQDRQKLYIDTVADGGGRFVFPRVPDDAWLDAVHDGFVQVGSAAVRKRDRGGWHPGRIVLAPAGTLRVEVRNAAGRPVRDLPGVAVAMAPDETGMIAALQFGFSWFRLNAPAPDGTAMLTVPANLQLMLFTGNSYFEGERDGQALPRGAVSTDARPIMVAAGEQRTLRIVLATDTTVLVRVSDPRGQPVAGADLTFLQVADGHLDSIGLGETDARGQFERGVRFVDQRQLLVQAHASIAGEPHRAEQLLQPGHAQTAVANLQLAPGQAVVGRVVDARGNAVKADVYCEVLLPGASDHVSRGRWSTDKLGTFRVPANADMAHRLEVVAAGFDTFVCDNVRAGSPPIDVVLEDMPRVRTRLLTGPEVTELEVRVGYFAANDGADPMWRVLDAAESWSQQAEPSSPMSDRVRQADGDWRFEELRKTPVEGVVDLLLERGPATISVTGQGANGEQLSRVASGPVTITDQELELSVALSPTVKCRGRIEFGEHSEHFRACVAFADDKGRLLNISVEDHQSTQPIHVASSYGYFALAAIPKGVWELRVGTRSELERGDARWRRRVVLDGDLLEPIVVRL